MSRRDIILDTLADAAIDLVDYNRRDDEELGEGEIESAIAAGEITIDEMVQHFGAELYAALVGRGVPRG